MTIHDATSLPGTITFAGRYKMGGNGRGWRRGRDAIIASITSTGRPDLRHIPTHANGQAAIRRYVRDPRSEIYKPAPLEVLGIQNDRVKEITTFAFPHLLPRFGLPGDALPALLIHIHSGTFAAPGTR